MENCPICQKPYGKIKRCYACSSKRKTGKLVNCIVCNKEFYVQNYILLNSENVGKYCSNLCKYENMKYISGNPENKHITQHGYVKILVPNHPRASRGRVFEHIIVMENSIGRYLEKDEHVHHINHIKSDNRIENLQLITNTEHSKLHAQKNKEAVNLKRVTINCATCGKEMLLKPSRAKTKKTCSMECRNLRHSVLMIEHHKNKQ